MKKLLIIVTMLALFLSACTTTDQITENAINKETIKIGVIAPLTGENAVFGQNTKAGAEFAFSQLGDTKYNYKLIVDDDGMQNSKTVSIYQKFVNVDKVDAVIGISSGSGNAIAPLAEEDKVLFCSIASDPAIVKDRTYVFKHWTSPEAEAIRYVEELKKLGTKKVVILQSIHDGTKAVGDVVILELDKAGIDHELIEIDLTVTDARTELLKLDDDFDMFLNLLLPSHIVAITKQVKELGFTQEMSSIENFEYVEDGVDIFNGMWYINAADPIGKFKAQYENVNGEQPGVTVPNAYDCLNILVQAFENSENKEEAYKYIHELKNYQGAMGNLYYNKGSIESPAVKKMVQDGRFVIAK